MPYCQYCNHKLVVGGCPNCVSSRRSELQRQLTPFVASSSIATRLIEAQAELEAERQKNTFLRIELDQVRVDILERDATIHKLMGVPIDKIEALDAMSEKQS